MRVCDCECVSAGGLKILSFTIFSSKVQRARKLKHNFRARVCCDAAGRTPGRSSVYNVPYAYVVPQEGAQVGGGRPPFAGPKRPRRNLAGENIS